MDVGVALFGGAFDPPHVGHVALAAEAKRRFGLSELVVLVSATPGHKVVHLRPESRLELARAAFPDDDVRLDPYPRTVELLRAGEFVDPLLLLGADEFREFLSWTEPDVVLELARLAVATRPGYPADALEPVVAAISRPERVAFFELEPNPAASRDIRGRAAAGEPLDGLVPPAVARLIARRGFYAEA